MLGRPFVFHQLVTQQTMTRDDKSLVIAERWDTTVGFAPASFADLAQPALPDTLMDVAMEVSIRQQLRVLPITI